MTIAQKRAIGYAIREKERKENIAYLKKIGRYDEFLHSKYRYEKNFIRYQVERGAAK